MSGDNPYSGFSGYGAPQVNAGGGEVPANAAPVLIKDTTTQSFTQDVIAESRKQPVLVGRYEVQRVLVPFKATLRMDTTKTPPVPVKQDLFMLVWQLCVVKSVRVVTETEIEEIDELAAALQVTEG